MVNDTVDWRNRVVRAFISWEYTANEYTIYGSYTFMDSADLRIANDSSDLELFVSDFDGSIYAVDNGANTFGIVWVEASEVIGGS